MPVRISRSSKPHLVRAVGSTAKLRPTQGTGPRGPEGPEGPQGAPGGSDASFAGWVSDTASQTRGALDGAFADVSALAPRSRPGAPRGVQMIATWQAGHVWTTGGADNTAKNLNDTSDYVIGSQSALVVTQAGTTTTATFQTYPIAAIDMTGKQFVLWVKAENMPRLGSLTLRAGSNSDVSTNYYTLRVSGGAVTNAILGNNEWVPVTFSFSDAVATGIPNRAAITALQFRVAPNGANSEATRVRFGGFGMFAEPATLYPNGVVSLTFDDNYLSVYTRAKATMSRYGFAGTAFVIKDTVGADADHMSLAQLRDLQDSHGWGIGGHSWSAASHNQPNGLADVPADQLGDEMRQLKAWLLENGFRGVDHFAYPKGQFNTDVEAAVGRYFATAGMTTNYIKQTLPFYRPMRLARVSVANTDTPAALQALIDDAYTNRTWLNLCFHNVVASGAATPNDYNQADFDTVMAYLNTKGIPVRTVGQVIDSLVRL